MKHTIEIKDIIYESGQRCILGAGITLFIVSALNGISELSRTVFVGAAINFLISILGILMIIYYITFKRKITNSEKCEFIYNEENISWDLVDKSTKDIIVSFDDRYYTPPKYLKGKLK